MTTRSRPAGLTCLALPLLALLPGLAVAEGTEAAPLPETVIGTELRLGPAEHLGFDRGAERSRMDVGAGLFVRRGRVQLGIAGESVNPLYDDEDRWVAPGTSLVRRPADRRLVLTAGLSSPATFLGDRWLWRHLQADLLAEAGAGYTRLREDLGGGGPGDRAWDRWTPLVGLRAGLSMRLGGRFHGFFGLAGFYRHALGQDHVTTVTGRRELVVGDSVGLVVFGGADLRVR